MMPRKYSDEQILDAYQRTGSCHRAGKDLGLTHSSVHERLVKLGKNKPINVFTPEDTEKLKKEYQKYALIGKLDALARQLGRTKYFICRQARELGLTDQKRPRDYSSIWKNMTEQEASVLWEDFKATRLTLSRFCKVRGIGETGFWRTMTKFFPDEYEGIIESKTPKTSIYRLGRQFEYRIRDYLKKLGFFVLRSPASKSPIDLVAIRKGLVLFVQCKTSGTLPPKEWNALLDLSESVGAVPVLAEREKVRGILFHKLKGRKDGSKRAQPYELFTPERSA